MENEVPPPIRTSPPPITLAPPPQPPHRGRGWMITSLILGALLLLLLGSHFVELVSDSGKFGAQSGRRLEEITVEQNGSDNKIAIIDVQGLITGEAWDHHGRSMVDLIEEQLKIAGRDKAVKAVLLKVDSPGGEVLASDNISRALSEFQEKNGKPVIAVMGGLAASGGYYVSAPCQWIVANDLTLTGSIGVIMHTFNYRGLLDKIGLYPQVFKSGKFKDMLSGSRKPEEIDPKEREMIDQIIDETYKRFKSVVAKGRQSALDRNQGTGRRLVGNWDDFADGRVLTGRQAFEYGFVDETGSFSTAVARAKKIAKINDANLVRYQEPFSLLSLFSLFGKSEMKSVKLDVGFELPKLQAGQLYFLSPTVLH